MVNLTNYNKYYRTTDASALITEIKQGQTAYINGGKVIGDAYTPAMMEFDGSSGYYIISSITTSGNKVFGVLRFNRLSFTGTTRSEFMLRVEATPAAAAHRVQIDMFSSDNSTVDRRDTVAVNVKNSAGTKVCAFYSPVGYLDGNSHTLFFSYNGDTGTAIFYIDGVDADDAGNSLRVAPVTGTLATGSTGQIFVGWNTASSNYFGGEIGFLSYRDAYLTNWQDFMDNNGNPKALDESTWTEWGTQPLLWNPHGFMEDNRGSAGNMTKNGTIIVGDGGNR